MRSAAELLRSARLVVSPETFHVVSVGHEDWRSIVSNPELSPDMSSEFILFKDRWEVTLVVNDADFSRLRPALSLAKIESGYRLLSFDADLDFDVVRFIAEIARILANHGISILPLASFARDHVLVRQSDLARSLKAFRGIVDEVC